MYNKFEVHVSTVTGPQYWYQMCIPLKHRHLYQYARCQNHDSQFQTYLAFQINHQPDATIFQFIILTFIYSSTCFGRFSRPSSGAQWLQWQPLVLPSYRGDSHAVFVVRPAGPTMDIARLSPRYEGKTRDCHCSHWPPDDGRGKCPKHVEP